MKRATSGCSIDRGGWGCDGGKKEIATGDQPNDVLMFKRSGLGIAMGNAADAVKTQAAAVTDTHNAEASPRQWGASFLVRRNRTCE